ncbi:3906_t:CDS:2 [Ambispora leptoticha]|uniref:Deoxyuridine 5'-triphosphate nucleotidohydrolase n=1 Tax=Ambispora leptoticha TaxID=144679 RepID=A0A9N9FV65_9GLOM|nr:3906_t:CDS:2 [Ambispora leptoticha]
MAALSSSRQTTKRPILMDELTPPSTPQQEREQMFSSSPQLKVQLMHKNAQMPRRGSGGAAGYDLYSAEDTVISARGKALISTGLAIQVPYDAYGRIAPRSSLASKNSIDCGAGVIDADYRGEVKILLFNFGDSDFPVKTGDRIAQLIIERIYTPEIVKVDELDNSPRGDKGFGSTGLR